MTSDERQAWLHGLILIAVPGWYFGRILSEARTTPVGEIAYQSLLLWNIGLVILGTIVAMVVAMIAAHVAAHVGVAVRDEIAAHAGIDKAMGARRDARETDLEHFDRTDERDAGISRFGGAIAGYVLAVAVLLPLGLAMVEAEPFWIAQTLYGALIVSSLASTGVKLVAYRRGVWA